MIITIDYPIYSINCDTCKNKFKCFTSRVHKEIDVNGGRIDCINDIESVSIDCIKVEPKENVKSLQAYVLPSGNYLIRAFVS